MNSSLYFNKLLYLFSMYSKNIIIGSGPAGVSAASEILENNKDVLILDVGSEIEEEKKNIIDNFLENKNIKEFKEKIIE